MAKGRPPPFVTRGKAAAMPARLSRAAASAPPAMRRPPPPEGSPAEEAMDRMQGAPAFRKGGKVGGSFPKGKQAKMPR